MRKRPVDAFLISAYSVRTCVLVVTSGALAYILSGDMEVSAVAALAIVSLSMFALMRESVVEGAASAVAILLSFAVAGAVTGAHNLAVVMIVCACVSVCLTAFTAKKRGARDAYPVLLVAAIPILNLPIFMPVFISKVRAYFADR